ncbi:MAG TPA: DNA polymerase III subunit gamma/tau [Candidatus Acidoferrales bacterium]|nr:DNA polymerase III subunit gamma/tau [Candidatus Acidoferrales bacterium]
MTYQVIARKWRPQTFADIVGQQHVTRTLQNAIRAGRVAHAYIFSGVRGVGKTTTARVLAKALNCVHGPAAEPCNDCDRCREITAGSSLDVMEIDAASNRGIDQIRELREMVRYAPATGRNRVVILDEAHQLTEEASNALLKTLEEPPDRVIFILATTAPENLPETIRSRAQHFHFRALSFAEIVDALDRVALAENLTLEPGAAAVLARAAEGSLRDALSLLEQAIAYCDRAITDAGVRELLGVVSEEALDELVEAAASGSAEGALKLVHRMISSGENLDSFCREAIRHVRNLLVVRIAGADSPLVAAAADERPRLARQAARFTEEDLTRFFQVLMATHADLRRHPDPRIHLELGLLRLVNAARLGSLEDLLAELRGATPPPRPPTAGPAPGPSTPPGAAPRGFQSVGFDSSAVASTPGERPSAAPPVPPAAAAPPQSAPAAASMETSAPETDGLDAEQVRALRAAVADGQQKFLASLLDHVARWELAGNELRLYFPAPQRALADMLQAREPMEKLRLLSSRVLGQALRVCVKLMGSRPAAAAAAAEAAGSVVADTGNLRAQFEQDPTVRAVLDRFGGRISGVKPAGGS